MVRAGFVAVEWRPIVPPAARNDLRIEPCRRDSPRPQPSSRTPRRPVHAGGRLSAQEQYFLELINRGRANPVAEAARFGIDLNEGLAAGTLPPDPAQPLAVNGSLAGRDRGPIGVPHATGTFTHAAPATRSRGTGRPRPGTGRRSSARTLPTRPGLSTAALDNLVPVAVRRRRDRRPRAPGQLADPVRTAKSGPG